MNVASGRQDLQQLSGEEKLPLNVDQAGSDGINRVSLLNDNPVSVTYADNFT